MIIRKAREVISAREEVLFAYLFGSLSKGTAGKMSDVDIAVFLDQDKHAAAGLFGYQSEFSVELERLLQERVDLVILNSAPLVLRFKIIKDGQLMFCRSESARRAFHERTIREYLDFRPFLRAQNDCLRRRLAEGTFGGGKCGGH
jgi:predicted nucleotidyltransferase